MHKVPRDAGARIRWQTHCHLTMTIARFALDLSRHDAKDWKSSFWSTVVEKDDSEFQGVKRNGSEQLVPELLRENCR